jgi:hypothetical protein
MLPNSNSHLVRGDTGFKWWKHCEIVHHQGMFFHSLSYSQLMKCKLLSLTVRYHGQIKRKSRVKKISQQQ